VVYYHGNTLFSVYCLTDDGENVVERYRFDGYGACTVLDADGSDDSDNASDVENPFLFTGRRLDSEWCGMQYRHRSYSTTLGRFVSRDPSGYSPTLSLYEYGGSRCTFALDPSGLRLMTPEEMYPEQPVGPDPMVWVYVSGELAGGMRASRVGNYVRDIKPPDYYEIYATPPLGLTIDDYRCVEETCPNLIEGVDIARRVVREGRRCSSMLRSVRGEYTVMLYARWKAYCWDWPWIGPGSAMVAFKTIGICRHHCNDSWGIARLILHELAHRTDTCNVTIFGVLEEECVENIAKACWKDFEEMQMGGGGG
jgi:RHS repeat-associated protein